MLKNFVGDPFSVSLISGTKKVWIKGGGYQDFPSKNPCLTVPKLSVGESFTMALISGIKKVWMRKGLVSRFSVEIFLSHTADNFRRGLREGADSFRKSINSGI